MDKDLVIKTGVKCLQDEAQALMEIAPRIDENFVKAVELIYNCKGKFIVTGVGKSGHVGAKIAATLASLGTPSFFVNPLDAYHGDLGMFDSNDVVMAVSYSGNTDELLRFIPMLIDRNIPIIGMSGNPDSLLAKYSVCHLDIHVSHEADPLNLAPTSSTTAQMAMGDAIACALVKVRHFKESDFAQFHPGGSLGRKLLCKVKDCMVKTNLPIVSPDTKISDTIIEMSRGKLGLVIAVENEKICGIVTDGDIRRAMQSRQEEFFSLKVTDIMSRNPKLINQSAKISEAEEKMHRNKIHALIVTDDEGRMTGIIDSFSCF
jgi:arabinose-5-phosphate isomerase